MPAFISRRVKRAARSRMTMVMGMAALVRPSSASPVPVTMTRNWTVKPRKKKKSNLRRAMLICWGGDRRVKVLAGYRAGVDSIGLLGASARATYLIVEESLLHPIVGTNLLQDIPGEHLVELPGDETHHHRRHGDDDRDGYQVWPHERPQVRLAGFQLDGAPVLQLRHGVLDLVDLDGRVDQDGHVGGADADDLNRVLHPQGIPHEDQLVQVGEEEEGEDGRVRLVLRRHMVVVLAGSRDVQLELDENIAALCVVCGFVFLWCFVFRGCVSAPVCV